MRGPYFERLLDERELSLERFETVEDLEMMYSIIIEERGKDLENLTELDEEIALSILCKIPWPGKRPEYRTEVVRLKRSMRGISRNSRLQYAFRTNLREEVLAAESARELDFGTLTNIFRRRDRPRPRPRSR